MSGAAKHVLVTGAGGQLGRTLVDVCRERGIRVTGLAHGELDIADGDAFRRTLDRIEPDVVVNCAAFTRVDACEDEIEAARHGNEDGPRALALECRGRALLVHVSTEYVFSGRASTPIPEDAEPEPLSEYGRSKLAGERAVREVGGEHLIVRTQWVFGPGGNFVRTMLDLAEQGRPLRVVEDQIGRPTWTGTLAPALLDAVAAGARGTLHLACEGVASWFDLAVAAIEEGARRGWNESVPLEAISTAEMPRPASRPAYAVLGLERARKLGIKLPHWRRALADYLDGEEVERA